MFRKRLIAVYLQVIQIKIIDDVIAYIDERHEYEVVQYNSVYEITTQKV